MRSVNDLLLSAPADIKDPQLFLWLERVREFAVSCGDKDMDWLVKSIKTARSAGPISAVDKLAELKARLEVVAEVSKSKGTGGNRSKPLNLRLFDEGPLAKGTAIEHPYDLTLCDEPAGRDINSVFLVHGHNDKMRFEVKDFLQNVLGYSVIVLSEQPDNGRTIIAKLCEEIKRCGRAVVLYSPDDEMSDGEMRARQNVVFEHGLLYSELGTENVIAMVDGSVRMPGDLDGVIYVSYKDDWKERIRRNWRKG